MMKNIRLLLALFLLMLSGCTTSFGAELSDPSDGSAGPVETSATMPEVEAPEPTTDDQESMVTEESEIPGGAEALVDLARTDLAQRLDVEISAITFVSYEEVFWPDASLGCPVEGINYAQVITRGSDIVLQFEETIYHYHSDLRELVLICMDETETLSSVDGIDTTVKDGGPNETKDDDVIIQPPTERK